MEHVDVRGKRVLEVGPGSDLGTGELLMRSGAASYAAVDLFRLAAPVEGLDYFVTDFPGLSGVPGGYDVVVSNATLEHVADVAGLFRRLAELSTEDAVWCHHVDAKTHMRWVKNRDPWNILRYSNRMYRLISFPGAPNRMLASDYLHAAKAAGFTTRVVPGRLADPAYLTKLNVPASAEDLRLLTFTLVASRDSREQG